MSFAMGPFAISLNGLALALGFFISLLIGWLAGRKRGVTVEPALSAMFLLGMIGARLGFVLFYLHDYLAQPLSIIDIRDGGFTQPVGVGVAVAAGCVYAWRNAATRVPLAIAVTCGSLTWAAALAGSGWLRPTQTELPQVALVDLRGADVSLQALKGRPLVVNLWATWCPPCRKEMPVLAQAQRTRDDVRFVFINQGEPSRIVNRYLESEQLTLDNVLLDINSDFVRQLGADGLPTTYFYDAQGRLAEIHFGELSHATLKHNLKAITPTP